MHHISKENLVQYLYDELSETKSAAIQAALISDNVLRDEFELLKDSHKDLSAQKLMSPSKRSLDFIMNYAEKSVEEFSTHA